MSELGKKTRFYQLDESKIRFLVALDRTNVEEIFQHLNQEDWGQFSTLSIDLEQVGRIDSMGLVMLIHLIELLEMKLIKVYLINHPPKFKMLCKISHLENLLENYKYEG